MTKKEQKKIEALLIERERLLWGLRRIIIAEGQLERHAPDGHDYYDGYEDGICWAMGVAKEAIEKAGLKDL